MKERTAMRTELKTVRRAVRRLHARWVPCLAAMPTALLVTLLMVADAPLAQAASPTFTALAARMTAPRSGHTATLIPGGQVVLIGGEQLCCDVDGSLTYDTAERYDPETQMFTPLNGRMVTPREDYAAALLPDGRIFLVGGFNTDSDCLDSAEVYNPVSDTFTPLNATMALARCDLSATLLDSGLVLVAGGGSDNVDSGTAELYDPAADRFSPVAGVMSAPRSGHAAVRLLDGRVLLTGGVDSSKTALSTAEVYDPATKQFTALTRAMTSARAVHRATLLPNGQVLITGGIRGSLQNPIGLDTAEVYDPTTNTFTALGTTMTSVRALHTATQLLNGEILITGGVKIAGGNAFNTAEVYTSGPANTATAAPSPTSTPEPVKTPTGASVCVGDCDSSGAVTVNEIITLVDIALGTQHASDCPHGLPATATDTDVTVAVIIRAVNNALSACNG